VRNIFFSLIYLACYKCFLATIFYSGMILSSGLLRELFRISLGSWRKSPNKARTKPEGVLKRPKRIKMDAISIWSTEKSENRPKSDIKLIDQAWLQEKQTALLKYLHPLNPYQEFDNEVLTVNLMKMTATRIQNILGSLCTACPFFSFL
jgi:hypothetical protein